MQGASKMTEPDYGVLLDDMVYADGARIPADRFSAPRLEVELAFVLGKRLGGKNVTIYDVLDATAYVTPAMEIIDYRTERSEERRVGKECVSTCRSRWSPYH